MTYFQNIFGYFYILGIFTKYFGHIFKNVKIFLHIFEIFWAHLQNYKFSKYFGHIFKMFWNFFIIYGHIFKILKQFWAYFQNLKFSKLLCVFSKYFGHISKCFGNFSTLSHFQVSKFLYIFSTFVFTFSKLNIFKTVFYKLSNVYGHIFKI